MQADDARTLQLMRKEIGIMQRVSYDRNIVQFYGACTTTEPAMLVMEYMQASVEPVGVAVIQVQLPRRSFLSSAHAALSPFCCSR